MFELPKSDPAVNGKNNGAAISPQLNAGAPRYRGHELERLTAAEYAQRHGGKCAHKSSGGGYSIRCPAHNDRNNSASVKDADNGGLVFNCFTGCTPNAVLTAVRALGVDPSAPRTPKPSQSAPKRVVKTYPFTDEHGALLYEKVRYQPKSFGQRRPRPDGGWDHSLGDVRRVPYRLQELVQRAGKDVHICEGEKDADTLAALSLLSTSIDSPAEKHDLTALHGRHVTIHADNDPKGEDRAREVASVLHGKAASIRIVRYPDTKAAGDVTDWLAQGHTREELQQRCEEAQAWAPGEGAVEPPRTAPDWPDLNPNGRPVSKSQRNIVAFLEYAGITLRQNTFTHRAEAIRRGRTISFDDATLRAIRLEADALGLSPHRDYFEDVLKDLARRNSYHPVREYLDALSWDGVPRLETWLIRYADAPATPFVRAAGRKTLIAGVRRIMKPGSKFDNCLTLEGVQYAGKSSLVRALAGDDWFSDSLQIGTDPKDTIEQTAGKWICELPELVGIGKRGRERVKAFLSRSTDRAALKYERLACDVPRQFICMASTNDAEYLDDPSGNRRFWPVRVGTVDIDALRKDRDQLWAEVVAAEANGESTELPRDLWDAAADEQKKRLIGDPWLERLEPVLEGKCGAVAKADLWRFLDIGASRQDRYARVEGPDPRGA